MEIRGVFPPKAHVWATFGVSASASVAAFASTGGPIDESYDMGKREFEPIPIGTFGGFPVVVVPEFSAQLHLTGILQATFSASAEMHASNSLTYDSDTGFTPQHDSGGSGSGTYNATLDANIKVAFEPTVKLLLEGLSSSYISASLSPYVEVKADACNIVGHSGVDLRFGMSIGVTKATSSSKDFTFPVVDTTLFTIPWRNCAVWSGTMTFKLSENNIDNKGRAVENQHWSDNVTIIPPADGLPPLDGQYATKGSGSGALILNQYSCDPDPVLPILELPVTSNYNWGGDLNLANQSAEIQTVDGFTSIRGPFDATMAGTGDITSVCGNQGGLLWTHHLYPGDFYRWVDPASGGFKFATPPGQSDFTDSFKGSTPNGSGTTTFSFVYTLHKACTAGGTDC